MSKIQHPTTTENLPDEILLNIFVRLLAKQLAQMRSVSKSWSTLLSHPSFVKSHLHRSMHNNNEQIFLIFYGLFKPFKQYSSQSSHLEPTNVIKHTPKPFREIPVPDSLLDSNHITHHLGVLGGKLCEISWHKNGAWEVWVMEEYGVPKSWVKRYVFPKFINDGWRFPFGFTSRNELLLVDCRGRLVLYDPIANKTKLTSTEQSAHRIVEYVDTLVWV
ncbi:unnamed protein product [Lactuca saligna]|uniref:F-box domain-containing protein n=1 Tax=Lactuca saligna TaxID=75948 RepID=A0AA35VDD5_LACSI|nr:unnamed protein product [Lactuca saligna]